ncbi:major outer membrane protein [Campylobacter sp. US33a]|uniref:Major outer membrane protein n=1 Tax=Campylobacter sp. CCS1377 TaxID=3158229 RepID=A0AAU7E5Y1_9BACT|nr:major outer membrane protein [Campylobacter sp. US33a]MCW1360618.1 major outer membrane protein [Campylobacter jejuni]
MKRIILCTISIFILSTFAHATPLDDVFEDVEVSGTIRYRYENQRVKGNLKQNNKKSNRATTNITIK